jgi:hypothetical protein
MKIKPTRKNCIDYLYLIAMHFNYEFVRHPDFERFKMYAEVAEESIELLKEQEAVQPIAKEDDTFECVCGAIVGWDELDSSGIVTTRFNYCPFCGKAVKWE